MFPEHTAKRRKLSELQGPPYAKKFFGKRTQRIIEGISRNVPQQAPQSVAKALVEVAGH